MLTETIYQAWSDIIEIMLQGDGLWRTAPITSGRAGKERKFVKWLGFIFDDFLDFNMALGALSGVGASHWRMRRWVEKGLRRHD